MVLTAMIKDRNHRTASDCAIRSIPTSSSVNCTVIGSRLFTNGAPRSRRWRRPETLSCSRYLRSSARYVHAHVHVQLSFSQTALHQHSDECCHLPTFPSQTHTHTHTPTSPSRRQHPSHDPSASAGNSSENPDSTKLPLRGA